MPKSLSVQFFPFPQFSPIKGVPSGLVDGLSTTIAHQVLGQGIVYTPFRDVGQHVGDALQRFAGRQPVTQEQRDILAMANDIGYKSVTIADRNAGRYTGEIVGQAGGSLLQDAGRRRAIIHAVDDIKQESVLGRVMKVEYERGRVTAAEKMRSQLSLDL